MFNRSAPSASRWVFASALILALSATPRLAAAQATTNPAATKPAQQVAPKPLAKPAIAPTGWWNDAIFYEVFVRSFSDSRQGPLAGDGIGDLQGLIEKLDYLNDGNPATTTDLGITALWLMPVFESPSYHGYDTTDYLKIEPDYGTNADFARLMTEAHRRGIKVIVDLVLNHHSDKHPWFIEAQNPASPRHDWYLWKDAKPDYKGPWNQEIWHRPRSTDNGAQGFYYGLFNRDMPDLNYHNPAVTAEMLKVCRFWLQDMKADGFRLDAIRHLIEDGPQQDNTPATHAWLTAFQKDLKAINPQVFTVGEVWAPSEQTSQYVNQELDTVFEFDLATAIIDSVNRKHDERLRTVLTAVLDLYPQNQYCTFLTNHDQPRVMTMFEKAVRDELRATSKRPPEPEVVTQEATQRATLAACLLMTLPGVPFLYYGEELGMTGDKPDPLIRTPMQWTSDPGAGFSTAAPWSRLSPSAPAISVQTQTASASSLLSTYRQLIALRNNTPALLKGTTTLLPATHPGIFAFTRAFTSDNKPERFIVVANLAQQQQTLTADELATLGLDSKSPPPLILCSNGTHAFSAPTPPTPTIPAAAPLVLPAQSILLFRISPRGPQLPPPFERQE